MLISGSLLWNSICIVTSAQVPIKPDALHFFAEEVMLRGCSISPKGWELHSHHFLCTQSEYNKPRHLAGSNLD